MDKQTLINKWDSWSVVNVGRMPNSGKSNVKTLIAASIATLLTAHSAAAHNSLVAHVHPHGDSYLAIAGVIFLAGLSLWLMAKRHQ